MIVISICEYIHQWEPLGWMMKEEGTCAFELDSKFLFVGAVNVFFFVMLVSELKPIASGRDWQDPTNVFVE